MITGGSAIKLEMESMESMAQRFAQVRFARQVHPVLKGAGVFGPVLIAFLDPFS
jgi:hypothetical protein